MTWTRNILNIKDAANATQPVIAYTDGTNFAFARSLLDSTGAILDPATAQKQDSANTILAAISTGVNGATPAGTNLIGQVSEIGSVNLPAQPSVTIGTYATGFCVGGLIQLNNATRLNSGSGLIQYVNIIVAAGPISPFDVYFFNTQPTNGTYADNTAFALGTDGQYVCGVAQLLGASISGGVPQLLQATNLAYPFKLSAPSKILYAVAVVRGSQSFAAINAFTMNVSIKQD